MFGFGKKKAKPPEAVQNQKEELATKIRRASYASDRLELLHVAVKNDWVDVLSEAERYIESYHVPKLLLAAAVKKSPQCLGYLMAMTYRTRTDFCHKDALLTVAQSNWAEGLTIVLREMKRGILFPGYFKETIKVAAMSQSTQVLREVVRLETGFKYEVAEMLHLYGSPATQREMFFYLSGNARVVLRDLLARESDEVAADFLAALGRDPAMTPDWADMVISTVADFRPGLLEGLISSNLDGYPIDLCVSRILREERTELLSVLIDNGASPAQVAQALLARKKYPLAFRVMEDDRLTSQSSVADMQSLAIELIEEKDLINVERKKAILARLLASGIDCHAQEGMLMTCALQRDKSLLLARCLIEHGFDMDAYREKLLGQFRDDKNANLFIRKQAELHLARLKYRQQGYQILQDDILLRRTPLGDGELLQICNFTTGKVQVVVNATTPKEGKKAHRGDWMLEGEGRLRLSRIFTALGGNPQLAERLAAEGLGKAGTSAVAHKKALPRAKP